MVMVGFFGFRLWYMGLDKLYGWIIEWDIIVMFFLVENFLIFVVEFVFVV